MTTAAKPRRSRRTNTDVVVVGADGLPEPTGEIPEWLREARAKRAASDRFAVLRLDQIDESPLNPRKHFNEQSLAEMEASIRAHGVITPVLVRPRGDRYELAAGHRRRRGALRAGNVEIQAIVRDMTDDEFLEILFVENLQREDVSPLDEADAFRALLDRGTYDVHAIAVRIGKDERYVQSRLKLLELSPASREALRRDYVGLGHATELGKLQHADQDAVLEELFNLSPKKLIAVSVAASSVPVDDELVADAGDDSVAYDDEDDLDLDGEYDEETEDNDFREQPLGGQSANAQEIRERNRFRANDYKSTERPSVNELKRHLVSMYRELSRVPWDLADADLLPLAGSCTACPKRSGITPALFDELDAGKDVCLDRVCYKAKQAAHIDRFVQLQRSESVDVVKISEAHSGKKPRGALRPHEYKVVAEGTRGAQLAVVVDGAEAGTSQWVKVTKKEKDSDSTKSAPIDYEAQRKAREAKVAELQPARTAAVNAVLAKVDGRLFARPQQLRAILSRLVDAYKISRLAPGHIEIKGSLDAYIGNATLDQLAKLLVLHAMGEEVKLKEYTLDHRPAVLNHFATLFRANLQVAKRQAKAAPRAPKKAAKTAAKKTARKKAKR